MHVHEYCVAVVFFFRVYVLFCISEKIIFDKNLMKFDHYSQEFDDFWQKKHGNWVCYDNLDKIVIGKVHGFYSCFYK